MSRNEDDHDEHRRQDPGAARVRAERDADEHTSEPTGGIEGPALEGTVETGRPDREQIGAGDRADLTERIHQHRSHPDIDPLDEEPETTGFDAGDVAPSEESDQRLDRSESTGQRAQTEDRHGETETDTHGEQRTRATLGLETEPTRRSHDIESTHADRRTPHDIERTSGKDREREHTL